MAVTYNYLPFGGLFFVLVGGEAGGFFKACRKIIGVVESAKQGDTADGQSACQQQFFRLLYAQIR